MSVESFTPMALQFTEGAAHKVKSLVDEEGNDRLKLRVFVTGRRLFGFSVRFHF
jgi:iron-sulfur cluster insertion protein